MPLLFDCETDGLLHDVTTVHCLVIKDIGTGQVDSYVGPAQVRKALPRLTAADRIIAHNGIKYDIPVLQKLFPGFQVDESRVFDTLVLSRLIHADIKEADFDRMKTQGYPGKLCGSHSLKAWGYRLGKLKGEYAEKAGAVSRAERGRAWVEPSAVVARPIRGPVFSI